MALVPIGSRPFAPETVACKSNTSGTPLTSVMESSKTSVDLAVKSRDFAQLRLDAENKKYELGTSQIFLVLSAQGDLINAESNVVVQSVSYRRNVLALLRTTGELLEQRGVAIQ